MEGLLTRAARHQQALSGEPFHRSNLPNGAVWTAFHRTPSGIVLRFPGLADFAVSPDGFQVVCTPAPDVPPATAEHLYISQVLPLTQSKRGKLVFHASSVEVAGAAIAFLGESGRGKSTLAAHFAVSGYRFLTDDGLVLERGTQGFDVQPSHASIRLWHDSQEWLVPDAAKAPPLDYTSKSRLLADTRLAHCVQARPLRAAYFLGDGNAKQITFSRLGPAETLVKWLEHSFLLDVEDRELVRSHFDRAACLANEVVCYHLDYPRRYDDLGRLTQAVVKHATLECALK